MGWLDNPGQLLQNQEGRIRNTFSDTSGVTGKSGLTHPTRNAHMLIQNTDPMYRMLNPQGGNQTKTQRLYDQGLVSSGQAFVGNYASNQIPWSDLFSSNSSGAGTSAGSSSPSWMKYAQMGQGQGGGSQGGMSAGTASNLQMQQQTEELMRQQREQAKAQRLAELLREVQNG